MEKDKAKTVTKVEAKEAPYVSSTKTADFPSFDWSIQSGETKQLPNDARAQEEILSKFYITPIK